MTEASNRITLLTETDTAQLCLYLNLLDFPPPIAILSYSSLLHLHGREQSFSNETVLVDVVCMLFFSCLTIVPHCMLQVLSLMMFCCSGHLSRSMDLNCLSAKDSSTCKCDSAVIARFTFLFGITSKMY